MKVQEIVPCPFPVVLLCPKCGLQHVDAPEPELGWSNPPHKSHTCRPADGGCGHIWRPSDHFTVGIAAPESRGSADHEPPAASLFEKLAVVRALDDNGIPFSGRAESAGQLASMALVDDAGRLKLDVEMCGEIAEARVRRVPPPAST